jgi:serine/threonine protein phosphatase PrpC
MVLAESPCDAPLSISMVIYYLSPSRKTNVDAKGLSSGPHPGSKGTGAGTMDTKKRFLVESYLAVPLPIAPPFGYRPDLDAAGPTCPLVQGQQGAVGLGAREQSHQPVDCQVTGDLRGALARHAALLAPMPLQRTPHWHALTHTGLVRAHKPNEDAYLFFTTLHESRASIVQWRGLFLVADGMGGHHGGQDASAFVVNAIYDEMEALLRYAHYRSEDLKQRFVCAVARANTSLFQKNNQAHAFSGTTLTGVLLLQEPAHSLATAAPGTYLAHVVNVGDSRTYLYSQALGLCRLTRDHSVVEDLVACGAITEEERYTHQRRNEIHRCLGENEAVTVDVFTHQVHASDRLLLCSDGLWEMVRDSQLAALLASSEDEPSAITQHLLQAALAHGGRDNVTALVITLSDH